MSATASVGYGSSGKTSGLSATATASLGSDTVTATDGGSSGSQTGGSWQAQQVSPSGGIATVSLSASANTTTKNNLAYATWTGSSSSAYYYAGPGAGQTGANANASAKGSVYPPVTISLPGTINDIDGTKKALTGQGVTAQLSAFPSGYKVSSYTWSFTGGTPIKNWDPTWPNSANPTQLVPLTDADKTGTDTSGNGIPVAPISFYYTKAGSLTVTCTVNYTAPDGKTGTVTVQSPSIIYIKPTATWKVDTSFNGMTSGFFYGYPNGPFGALELWGPIDITVPDPFAGGTGCIVQIANLDRGWARTPQNGQSGTYTKLSVLYRGGTTAMVKAPTGLDVQFPYPFGFNQNTNGSFTANNNSYTWQIGNKGFASDKPSQPYALSVSDGGGNAWYSSTGNDHFNTWVMYQPPSAGGQPTIYVPLQTLTWSWGGAASLNASTNKWSVGEGPPFIPGSPSVTDSYPNWNLSIPYGFAVGP